MCAVYIPPYYSLEKSQEFVNKIRNMSNRNKGMTTDFNISGVDWVNQEIKSHQYLKGINEVFIEMSHDLGMSQIVNQHTRRQTIVLEKFSNRKDVNEIWDFVFIQLIQKGIL